MGVIVTKKRKYIESYGGVRYVPVRNYFGKSDCGLLFDVLVNSYLDSVISTRSPQFFYLSVERSGKGRVVTI